MVTILVFLFEGYRFDEEDEGFFHRLLVRTILGEDSLLYASIRTIPCRDHCSIPVVAKDNPSISPAMAVFAAATDFSGKSGRVLLLFIGTDCIIRLPEMLGTGKTF